MTLTKSQIIDSTQNTLEFTGKQSREVVETLLEIIKGSLEGGEDVLVSGFGKFRVKEKSKRKGRNPATEEPMILDARRVVTFKCSGKLRDRVNSWPGNNRDIYGKRSFIIGVVNFKNNLSEIL
jgi:integration host factor subunit alpha